MYYSFDTNKNSCGINNTQEGKISSITVFENLQYYCIFKMIFFLIFLNRIVSNSFCQKRNKIGKVTGQRNYYIKKQKKRAPTHTVLSLSLSYKMASEKPKVKNPVVKRILQELKEMQHNSYFINTFNPKFFISSQVFLPLFFLCRILILLVLLRFISSLCLISSDRCLVKVSIMHKLMRRAVSLVFFPRDLVDDMKNESIYTHAAFEFALIRN